MNQSITKIDAARRQLTTAIRMFFDDRDAVSIYTLVHAAREIYEVLCKKNAIETFRAHIRESNPWVSDTELHQLIIGHRDFFKHADREPLGILNDFSDELNDHTLILAVEDCARLTGKLPIEAQVFQAWYFAVYPEKLADEAFRRLKPVIEELFPDFGSMPRKKQKSKGVERLEEARANPALLNDPKTDSTAVQ